MKLDTLFALFGILAFIAVFLVLEALFIWWREKYSQEAKRLSIRLKKINNDNDLFIKQHNILKSRLIDNKNAWLTLLGHGIDLERIDQLIMQSGKFWSINQFIQYSTIGFFTGILLGLTINMGFLIAFLLGLVFMFFPIIHIMIERNKRFDKFQLQLPEAIDSIARSLRAGHSFMAAFTMVGEELQDPIATEFRITLEESNLGVPLNETLLNMSKRVPVTDLKFFVIAILIQRESGGNLAQILTSMSKIIRERFKLMGEIKTLSAEGIMSAKVMWALPFLMIALMSAISPAYAPILFGTEMGIFLLKTGFFMMVVGGLWMRSVVKIKV
ncbi:MAG: hypothetical protein B7X95_08050 [Methylophilaceae bacterium 17-44-8]|jgi:tight adherence protein B|nr:MAG: hypothetical protein B7X95_08050 [Methylophilaceae bacterium 17-44-8]